ncbi:MAG TPA: GTP-binding protein, partial [bacterium]|nr:GTP-binding protein [bacterium]
MEIRNFCIISHIDHGKSTLADRFLEITKTVPKEKMREQFLDMMRLEREKGITIKLQPVRMEFNGMILNLVDTPGHVDFSYEVSRAMKAVEGAILLVDVKKGIQAQTLSNFLIAKKEGLKIIPALNKIDLKVEDLEEKRKTLADLVGVSFEEVSLISAKTGLGVDKLLERVIKEIPAPLKKYQEKENFSALIFDSEYDPHLGIIVHLRVFCGEVKEKDICFLYHQKEKFEVKKLGYFLPHKVEALSLKAGEIGWLATGIKEPEKVLIGDTMVKFFDYQNKKPLFILSGFKKPNPVVFASLYPKNPDDYENLVASFKKLHLNDSSLSWQEISTSLGRGLLVGFLGLLHLEITCARLKEEYQIETTVTLPTVLYRVELKNGKVIELSDISKMPPLGEIKRILEPYIKLEVFLPAQFLNEIFSLSERYRLKYLNMRNLGKDNLLIEFEAPLAEIIV